MSEIDFYQTVVPIYLGVLFVSLSLVIVFMGPISRWVDRMRNKRAKPA